MFESKFENVAKKSVSSNDKMQALPKYVCDPFVALLRLIERPLAALVAQLLFCNLDSNWS